MRRDMQVMSVTIGGVTVPFNDGYLIEADSLDGFIESIHNEHHAAYARAFLEFDRDRMDALVKSRKVSFEVTVCLRWDVQDIQRGQHTGSYVQHLRKMARRQAVRKNRAAYREQIGVRRRERDSQRSKVYLAEQVIRHQGETFRSIEDMQRYCDKLLGTRWAKANYPKLKLEVVKGRAGTSACALDNGVTIKMPEWAWCEAVLVHEIAHQLVNNQPYGIYFASHGREFCAAFLDLVGRTMGDEAKALLRASFVQHKVKHRAKRQMSPEAKAAAAERLATARAAKAK